MIDVNKLPYRHYAHPFDRPVEAKSAHHGVGRDSDAIGGYTGIGWYEVFRDRTTNELYRVHCSDGVYGGKSAHHDDDLAWMDDCRKRIHRRTKDEAARGVSEVKLSSAEWAILLTHVFTFWLDKSEREPNKTVGDSNRHLDEGRVGTINGVSVVVDPKQKNPLPLPPSQVRRELKEQFEEEERYQELSDRLDA